MIKQKQIKECTFRPKISNYLDSDIKKGKESKNNKSNGYNEIVSNGTDRIIRTKNKKKLSKNKNIFDELYEDGIKKLKLKRDKSQDQIDIEEQKEDLTFQPNIKHLDPKNFI